LAAKEGRQDESGAPAGCHPQTLLTPGHSEDGRAVYLNAEEVKALRKMHRSIQKLLRELKAQ
jgi:hypothetical protein